MAALPAAASDCTRGPPSPQECISNRSATPPVLGGGRITSHSQQRSLDRKEAATSKYCAR
eukprot:9461919-Pyramimonas_sp.AAC.1